MHSYSLQAEQNQELTLIFSVTVTLTVTINSLVKKCTREISQMAVEGNVCPSRIEWTNKNNNGEKERREEIDGGSVAGALGGEAVGEPPAVGAVVVGHVLALGPRDGAKGLGVELLAHPGVTAGGARRGAAVADAAV